MTSDQHQRTRTPTCTYLRENLRATDVMDVPNWASGRRPMYVVRGVCPCGWSGPYRLTSNRAHEDWALAHSKEGGT